MITPDEEASMSTTQYERIGDGLRRSFKITFGLIPGYGDDPKYSIERARYVIQDWMKDRIARNLDFLNGVLTRGEFLYAYVKKDGLIVGVAEPGGVFAGEVNILYDSRASDEDIEERLDDLATHLGRQLEQTRVYVTYRDKMWVLMAEGKSSPSDK
jgi:hypothetical protein